MSLKKIGKGMLDALDPRKDMEMSDKRIENFGAKSAGTIDFFVHHVRGGLYASIGVLSYTSISGNPPKYAIPILVGGAVIDGLQWWFRLEMRAIRDKKTMKEIEKTFQEKED